MSIDSTNVPEESLLRGYAGKISLLLAFGWLMIMSGRSLLPALLPLISIELSLTPDKAGFALTVVWLFYSVAQYPGGRFSDQLSRKTVLVFSLCALVLGLALLTQTQSYLQFLAAGALLGVGAGGYFCPTRALLSDFYSKKRGQAFGIQVASGRTGSAVAALSGGVALGGLAILGGPFWREAFFPVILLLICVIFLLHKWSKEPYKFSRVSLDLGSTGSRVFRNKKIRLILIAYIFFAITSQAFSSFLPTFLLIERGFSTTLTSIGFATLFLVGVPSTLLGGFIGDRFSRMYVTISALLIGAIGLIILLLFESPTLVIFGIIVYALGTWAFPPVMQSYLFELFPEDTVGGDFGALKTIYTGVGSFGSTYVGIVAAYYGSYGLAFVGLIVALLLGSSILFFINRSKL